MDSETTLDLKKGLVFGSLVRLPSDLTFSPGHMATLLASDSHVRPFHHVRYKWSHELSHNSHVIECNLTFHQQLHQDSKSVHPTGDRIPQLHHRFKGSL